MTMDIFKRMFALIGENGQGIGTSSFAQWVKNVTANLSTVERFAADALIDQCYEQLDEGEQRHVVSDFILLIPFRLLYSDWHRFSE